MANAPAYPVPNDDAAAEGITVREYFAARAPAEPQPWFAPNMTGQPEAEFHRQRYIQWPFAWADAVLAHKEGRINKDYLEPQLPDLAPNMLLKEGCLPGSP